MYIIASNLNQPSSYLLKKLLKPRQTYRNFQKDFYSFNCSAFFLHDSSRDRCQRHKILIFYCSNNIIIDPCYCMLIKLSERFMIIYYRILICKNLDVKYFILDFFYIIYTNSLYFFAYLLTASRE